MRKTSTVRVNGNMIFKGPAVSELLRRSGKEPSISIGFLVRWLGVVGGAYFQTGLFP
jgi:hypothetical protein